MKLKEKKINKLDLDNYLKSKKIMKIVCDYLGIPEELIQCRTRKREVVECRQFIHFFCKRELSCSNSRIGLWIGDRDHSTVIYSEKVINDLIQSSKSYFEIFQDIARKIEQTKSPGLKKININISYEDKNNLIEILEYARNKLEYESVMSISNHNNIIDLGEKCEKLLSIFNPKNK